MATALGNLRAILRALHGHALDARVYVDLTEIHNLGYYTGMTFEALSPRLGFALASGGRYDHLVGTFGAPQPAVGAALILDRLLTALRPDEAPARPIAPALLVSTQGDPQAHAAVEALRRAGLVVAIDLSDRVARPLYDYAQVIGAQMALVWSNGSLQRIGASGELEPLPSGESMVEHLVAEVHA